MSVGSRLGQIEAFAAPLMRRRTRQCHSRGRVLGGDCRGSPA